MSVPKSSPQYAELGELIARSRVNAGAGNQKEFANQLGMTQQSISRWEKGLSRPRAKDLPAIAKLLNVRETDLYAAAGYGLPLDSALISTATTFDRPLPVHALTPQSFERFCVYLIEQLYRESKVEQFGGPGHDQSGIDIVATGPFGVYSFQCKRVETFGAQKVRTVVATHKFKADKNFLLMSNVASPQAREEMHTHPNWEMWDREDLSRKFRTLPILEQINIVDIFFQGQRLDLIGRPDAGALVSPEVFYKPFLKDKNLFNHRWNLVGRSDELRELDSYLADDKVSVTLLVGPAGNGKTRLLRQVIDQFSSRSRSKLVLFASPTEEVKATSLENLGSSPKLIIADDVHDREDIGTLLNFCANSDNNARLLLALRPYGEERVRYQAANFGLGSEYVKTVRISPQIKDDALTLAREVLMEAGGPIEAAAAVAEATFGTPLVTVLGAQLVARDNIHPRLLHNAKDFQEHVLAKLQDVIAGKIVTGLDTPKMLGVLRVTALVQPIIPDDPSFLRLLKEVEGIDATDSLRLLRVLHDAGVLFKRGLRHRLAPDLLADAIIQRNFISLEGKASEKVDEVFELANEEHLKSLMLNLGRLEWRMRDGNTSGAKLLLSISYKLSWHGQSHVKAIEAVAYFQPRLALDFATRLIREGHGDDAHVCGMIRNASYNFDYVQEACGLLWKAGRKNPRKLSQTPGHGIRLLKELASFAPNKPKEYVKSVVQFALDLIERPHTLEGIYTPFEILEGALGAEMEERISTQREIRITTYALAFEFVRDVREQVIDGMFRAIASGSPRKAYLALSTLAHAMRGPMRVASSDNSWTEARLQLLKKIRDSLYTNEAHPVVLVKAASVVRGYAYHGDAPSSELATAIIALTNQSLTTRFVRSLIDGWGHETWPISESGKRDEHELMRQELIEELRLTYRDAGSLFNIVSAQLEEINSVAPGYGTPYLFINQLISTVPEFAGEVLNRYLKDKENPLSSYAGVALGKLIEEQKSEAIVVALDLVKEKPSELRLFADAYMRFSPPDGYSENDESILRLIFNSRDTYILCMATNVALQVSRVRPELAVELICTVDMAIADSTADDFFMWLGNENAIPESAIGDEQWLSLISGLSRLEDLDKYWIREFLKKAMRRHSERVLDLFKKRLAEFSEHENWTFVPLRKEHNGDGLALMELANGVSLLLGFLDSMLESPKFDEVLLRIGEVVAGLCGKFDSNFLGVLLTWMSHRTEKHAFLVAAILREAQSELIYDFPDFVREFLYAGELISDEATEELSSAIASSTWGGVKHGAPGEPFPEDVRLEKYSKEMLSNLSRADPAYELFESLLRNAEQQIAWQLRSRKAMDEDEE